MNIDLMHIHRYPAQSEETSCYSAHLVIDDIPICRVSNGGQGGDDDYLPFPGTERTISDTRRLIEAIAKQLVDLGQDSLQVQCARRVLQWN